MILATAASVQLLVVLPPRRAVIGLARFRWLGRLPEEAAGLAAVDALVSPQAFENKFAGGAGESGVGFTVCLERVHVIEQPRDLAQRCEQFGGCGAFGDFQ